MRQLFDFMYLCRNNHKIIVLSLLFTFLINFINGQGFRARCYTPNAKDHVNRDVFEISPGNYFGLGISIELQNGSTVYLLSAMGLNSLGQVQWVKTYGRKNLQYITHPFTIRTCYKQGNFIYYTGTMLDSNQKYIGTLVKFDHSGNIVWQKYYSDAAFDVVPQMLCPSVDGGFLITGFFQDNSSQPCLIIRTNSIGNELWRRKLNKPVPNVSDGKAILQDSASKKIVIVGYQHVGNQSSWEPRDNIIVLDSLGVELSRKYFNTGSAHDLVQTKDKKIVVVGNVDVRSDLTYQMSYALKFDINNPSNTLWRINNYGELTATNSFNAVAELPNGNLLIGGTFDSLQVADNRGNGWSRFVWVSPNGQVLKQKYYDYAPTKTKDNGMWLTSLNLTSDGGWITGVRCDYNPNNPMFYVKYDAMGCDSSSYYCATVGVNEIKTTDEELTIYPNPVENKFQVQADESNSALKRLTIANTFGQVVFTLNQPNVRQEIDISFLMAGIYYLTAESEDGQHIVKILKE